MIDYRVELKSTNASTAWKCGGLTKWARARRVYVRGYENGERVYSETIGFIDERNTGPKSAAYAVLERAEERLKELKEKAEREAWDEEQDHMLQTSADVDYYCY